MQSRNFSFGATSAVMTSVAIIIGLGGDGARAAEYRSRVADHRGRR